MLTSKNNLVLLDGLQDFMLTDILINKYNVKKSHLNKVEIININKIDKYNSKDKYNNHDKNTSVDKVNKLQNNENMVVTKCSITEKKSPDIFSPSEKDKLFWCFFVLVNGFEEYELSKKSSFKCEKEFKILSVEKLSAFKDKLKELKLKKTEIQDELVNQNVIGIKALYALCIINNMNLLYVKDRLLYELNTGADSEFKVIINENNNIYIPYNLDDSKLAFYRENYWKIENIQKPLNAFSGYSLGELQDICKKLNISLVNDNKKKTKKELYENILTKL